MITASLALSLVLATTDASAAQDVRVRDGGSAQVVLSSRELTHISMADGSRLEKLDAPDGALEIKPGVDADGKLQGDAFVSPTDPTPGKALSFFVRDNNGAVYGLVATVSDLPSQSILIHPEGLPLRPRSSSASQERADPYLRRIKLLMRAMEYGDRSNGYNVDSVEQVVSIWAQTETVLSQRWSGGDLRGEVWNVRNRSAADLRLDESQFTSLYPDVRAVAIDVQLLHPGSATRVQLLRSGSAAP